MQRLQTLGWWYWLVTVLCLYGAAAGYQFGLVIAIGLTAIQVIHFGWREGSPRAFPVQVRIAYLGLLLLSLLPGGVVILWLQLIGTSAMVLVNYCLLARLLSLLPWNRHSPVTAEVIVETLLRAPVAGSVAEPKPGWGGDRS